jgi:hypothetical protein
MRVSVTPGGFDVEVVDTAPDCPRCGTACLLAAWVPHGWRLTTGAELRGRGRVLLCSTCGTDDPYGAALITFFHVHGEVSDRTLNEFARLVSGWARGAQVQRVDQADFEEDVAAWKRGDFD